MGHSRKFSKEEERYLLNRLRKEWQAAERSEKLHEVARAAKVGGIFVAKSLLAFTMVAGVVTLAAIAPKAFAVYGELAGAPTRRFYKGNTVQEEMKRLQKRGYIHARKTEKGYEISYTEKGKRRVFRETASSLSISKPKKWDNTWWMVMFDIPRKHNTERDGFRGHLHRLGLTQLQESTFISKYPCKDEVRFLANLWNVAGYVVIAHVDALEGEGGRLYEVTKKYSL